MSREAAADAGHFTTMQVRGGRVQGRDAHLIRLVTASRALYGGDPGKAAMWDGIRKALRAAGQRGHDCTLRVRVLPPRAGYQSEAAPGSPDAKLRVEVDVGPPRQPPGSPLRVRTHQGLRAFPQVKHLALDAQHDARARAREAGFDDALLLAPDGRIGEGTFWNIAFWDGQAVVWPDAPALRGVTLQLLSEALERAGVPQRREAVTVGALGRLRAAFALNSTGIGDIRAIDGHRFPGDPVAGELLRRLLAQALAESAA